MSDVVSHDVQTSASAVNAPTRTRVVLDTSVLVADPACFHSFFGCDVVVPLTVVEELDGLKSRPDDVGRAARTALRTIEDLRRRAGGSIHQPVPLGPEADAPTVHIEVNGIQKHLLVEHGLDPVVPDNRIIGAALGQAMHAPTKVVSNDAGLRIKAAHLGLEAEEHQPIGRSADSRPVGWTVVEAGPDVIDDLYDGGSVDSSRIGGSMMVNEFAVARSGSQSALVR